MGNLVVASYLPGEGHFRSDRHDVRPVLCVDEHDYWAGLAAVWESDLTLVNVEHDVEATDAHMDALLACEYPLCAVPYACHWASTGLGHDVWSVRTTSASYAVEGDEWAQQSAIGLLKIAPVARIGPLARRPWGQLELAVEQAVQRPFHLHWEPSLPHHHW